MASTTTLPQENRSLRAYNRDAWDRAVADGSQWTVPVSPEEIAAGWILTCQSEPTTPRVSVVFE